MQNLQHDQTQVADLSFLFDEKILKLYVKLLIYSHLAPFGQMDYAEKNVLMTIFWNLLDYK